MNAHQTKAAIQFVQILLILQRLLGFNLLSHSDIAQTFVAQHNMHIIPPIKIVEGCENPEIQGC